MMSSLSGISGTHKNLAAVFLIAILATVIYSNSFDCSFHFDDNPGIVENYAIHRFDLKGMLSPNNPGCDRPVLNLTLALNYYFGKLNAFGYHLVNLLLHIANGIMLYFILLRTISFSSIRNKYHERSYRIALYAALIFTAHPIQTQAVTYIISRTSLLATFFYLLALLLFIHAFKQGARSKELRAKDSMPYALRPKLYLVGAFFASCLGMGSKQIAATIPMIFLIYDFYFISDGDWKNVKSHYKIHLAMLSTVAIVVYLSLPLLEIRKFSIHHVGLETPFGESITSFHYFLTQLHVIPYYIKLLFIPTNLNLDYNWPITRSIDLSSTFFFIVLTSIVILAIKLFHRDRLFSFGIIWFFVTLSVSSSFIVISDVIFEHRLYLPSVGFALFGAILISKISELRLANRRISHSQQSEEIAGGN